MSENGRRTPLLERPVMRREFRRELRARLMSEAARTRTPFDRAAVLADVGGELNLAPEHKVVADQSIDRLYSTAGQLDALLDLISRIIGSEWSIYSTIYPPYQGGA